MQILYSSLVGKFEIPVLLILKFPGHGGVTLQAKNQFLWISNKEPINSNHHFCVYLRISIHIQMLPLVATTFVIEQPQDDYFISASFRN